jgi:hypothetical protein
MSGRNLWRASRVLRGLTDAEADHVERLLDEGADLDAAVRIAKAEGGTRQATRNTAAPTGAAPPSAALGPADAARAAASRIKDPQMRQAFLARVKQATDLADGAPADSRASVLESELAQVGAAYGVRSVVQRALSCQPLDDPAEAANRRHNAALDQEREQRFRAELDARARREQQQEEQTASWRALLTDK